MDSASEECNDPSSIIRKMVRVDHAFGEITEAAEEVSEEGAAGDWR